MQAKNVLYAAVGAPVVAARKVGDQVSTLRTRVNEERTGYTEAAEKAINSWAAEGEKVVSRISDGAVVEEISSKVDLDQAKEQVSKLRDQLEDMLATWRASFRPEEKADAKEAAEEPAAKGTTARKPAAKKTSTATTTKSSTAAKKSSEKTTASTKTTKAS